MKIFAPFYQRMLRWSGHRHARIILFWLSFAESSFFPVPPDVMLIPMILAKPHEAWRNAWWCTMGGVLGAFIGYFIGMFFFMAIAPLLIKFGYMAHYQIIIAWFKQWGFWVMFFAGFAFIPYKLFTIAAGTIGLGLVPFTLGSLIGRGGRFFLVAALVKLAGSKAERWLENYIDYFAWLGLALIVFAYLTWRLIHQ
jgi:membrane protein YqaA with SNARE-associated domain